MIKKLINRDDFIQKIKNGFRSHNIVALLGPRQCGKTTLANQYKEIALKQGLAVTSFDLEDPVDILRLENPKLALGGLNGLIIIDEIQLRPNLFPILRVLIDKNSEQQKYIILGSASRDLIQQSSESLAGRIAYIEITPLNSIETDDLEKLWLVGGYPKSYLMPNMPESAEWRKNYIRTFLERDIPSLGIKIEPNALRRFWMMLAHYHGNICNVSELARSLNVTSPTIKRYIDILVGTFMLRELKPWHENISKRQVKQSKVYFRDSGLLHSMLGIFSISELQTNPKLGGSWEGYALEEVIRRLDLDTEDCYFWATHQGGELDLLVYKNDKKYGFEFKYSDAPTMTKSLYSALDSLELESVTIVYPGATSYQLSEQVSVKNLRHVTIV